MGKSSNSILTVLKLSEGCFTSFGKYSVQRVTSTVFPGLTSCLLDRMAVVVVHTDLVQRSHRNLGDVVRDELPGRALRITGREALSVPQVTYWKIKKGLI